MKTIQILLILLFFSCSTSKQDKPLGKKYFGIYIDNGPRQGFQYFDKSGKESNYRYFTSTVTNDTNVEIKLNVLLKYDSSGKKLKENSFLKSKIFLLPRKLTPKNSNFDRMMSKELKKYLDLQSFSTVSLNKFLKPNEKCVLIFGILTDKKYLDPTDAFKIGLSVIKAKSELSLKLSLNDFVIIPCGQISFKSKTPNSSNLPKNLDNF